MRAARSLRVLQESVLTPVAPEYTAKPRDRALNQYPPATQHLPPPQRAAPKLQKSNSTV